MKTRHYINSTMESFKGINMISKAPYRVKNDKYIYNCNNEFIGKIERGKSRYRECTLTDTELSYHGLKTDETWAFETLMTKLKPLEELWIKDNKKNNILPDITQLIEWACNKIKKI